MWERGEQRVSIEKARGYLTIGRRTDIPPPFPILLTEFADSTYRTPGTLLTPLHALLVESLKLPWGRSSIITPILQLRKLRPRTGAPCPRSQRWHWCSAGTGFWVGWRHPKPPKTTRAVSWPLGASGIPTCMPACVRRGPGPGQGWAPGRPAPWGRAYLLGRWQANAGESWEEATRK